jgi:iron-sulfur cluster repair protein YtfE (RIC family)
MTVACRCGGGHGDEAAAVAARLGRYAGDERIGDVAREPAALAVLERFGVNHCCGAHLSLREGAAAAGVELSGLLRALEEVGGRRAP